MKNISFTMTTRQFLDGTKDVTRRIGWSRLGPGDRLMAVEKAMGLRRGEKMVRLGPIEVVSVRREQLATITDDDVRREGYPGLDAAGFVEKFCKAMNCKPDAIVTRIEFRRVPVTQDAEARS